MKPIVLRSLFLLSLSAAFALGQEWDCQTSACEGHKAGYSWAMSHNLTEQDCDVAGEHTDSPSFAVGCKAAVQMQRAQRLASQLAEIRPYVTPYVQEYLLGKKLAKETRALPSDCQEAFKSLAASSADEVLATSFRTGCIEVAKKQANRIIKEDEKRAKEAQKRAKKQAREEARSADKTQ